MKITCHKTLSPSLHHKDVQHWSDNDEEMSSIRVLIDKIFFFPLPLSIFTFEHEPFYNSVNGSQAQLWTHLLVSGPVLLLTISATVVNIQAPMGKSRPVVVRRKNVWGSCNLKWSNLAQRLRFWESESWCGRLSQRAQTLKDSSIFSNISRCDRKAIGFSSAITPALREEKRLKTTRITIQQSLMLACW